MLKDMTSNMKRKWINAIYILVCFIVISLIAIDIFSNLTDASTRKKVNNYVTELMYYQDANSVSGLQTIKEVFKSGKFGNTSNNTLAIGQDSKN